MSGFTKLVPEIVLSSIWNESPEVRCVWIAMLATKDENGYVRGNAASLARIANVSLESAKEAIEKFQLPDPESNTPDNDGRRIQAVPGGWFVLNHALYRGKDYREYEAERKREYRRKHPLSGTCPGQVPDSSASASASVSAKKDRVQGKGKGKREAVSDDAGKLTPDNFQERAKAANGCRLTDDQLEAFCAYWTERNARGRCRFEAEKFFELSRRIATWASRERLAPAPVAAVKPDRPVWKDCAARCRFWDAEKKWCKKHVQQEPKICEQCKEF